MYLYHSSQKSKLSSSSITLTGSSVEKSVNWILDKHKQFGGNYYVGYYTDSLTPKAINRALYDSFCMNKFKNILFKPIKIEGYKTVDNLFDIDTIQYTSDTYGLNFNVSIFEDYTNYIVTNKNTFATLIKYQFQSDILRMLMTTDRSNLTERNVNRQANIELNGILTGEGNVYAQGVFRKLENEARRIYNEYIGIEQYPSI